MRPTTKNVAQTDGEISPNPATLVADICCRGNQVFRLPTKTKTVICSRPTTRGRCYDHNFLRFLTIFGEKIGVFLKYQCYDQKFSKFSLVLSQKRQFFSEIFGENILKIITSVPGIYLITVIGFFLSCCPKLCTNGANPKTFGINNYNASAVVVG
jgi:hypothetical protein